MDKVNTLMNPQVPAVAPNGKVVARKERKVKKAKASPASVLDASIELETNGGTTTIKLDKYRIELQGSIKLNMR